MATGTVLVLNTVDVAPHYWSNFYPRTFTCVFTEDTSIAYVEFRDSALGIIDRILNVEPGVTYDIKIDRPIHQLYFVPDALTVEKKLSISSIVFDGVDVLNTQNSAAGNTSLLNKSGTFINSDGTPADNIDFADVYMINGVLYGLSGLTLDGYMFYRVILKGRVVGYVIGNSATTITTSMVGYTNTTPQVWTISPNIGRMPLCYASFSDNIVPAVLKELAQASTAQYAAPPLPVSCSGSMGERVSSTMVETAASNVKQRVGLFRESLL